MTEDIDGQHVWVGAATVDLDDRQAKWAVLRHSVRLPVQEEDTFKVSILEVYCEACRRPFDDVAGEPCIAATTNEHLRGGPIGERRKRRHDRHDCTLLGCDTDDGGQAAVG